MNERVWTTLEILSTAQHYLQEKGIENPRGNAEQLLGKALGLPRIELYLQHDRPLHEQEVAAFRDLLRRRAKHEPLQLILGSVEFCGLKLNVLPGLLIPRPETEELIEKVVQFFPHDQPMRALDVGTGTGCIAIALAAALPCLDVDAVDDDFDAVRCTQQNAEQLHLHDRVRALAADLFSSRFMQIVKPPYDLVVSNPPYVTAAEHETLVPEITQHESRRALIGGSDGLAFYRRIAELLPALLKPSGLFAGEIGSAQSTKVMSIFSETLDSLVCHNDLSNVPRIIMGHLKAEVASSLPIL
jgi:release factor glutamine methyltransferase